jgi:hypothetical protein
MLVKGRLILGESRQVGRVEKKRAEQRSGSRASRGLGTSEKEIGDGDVPLSSETNQLQPVQPA